MSFWQTLKSKFSKKQDMPPVPTMEAINQQNVDLTQKEQSVDTLLNNVPAPTSGETQVLPASDVPVANEPAPITAAPTETVKKAAPKRKPVKKAVAKKVPAKKTVKKAAPKKAAPKKKRK